MNSSKETRQDVYTRITAQIVADLERGVRPWVRPWNAEHAAGRITRPLRHNGQPYTGINILSLWASASALGFAAPIWMTYRQASTLGAQVRKGEKGSPVVYANSMTRHETDPDSGAEIERDIHFLKGYTVFNVEQIDGLPTQYHASASPRLDVPDRIARADGFFTATGANLSHVGTRAFYQPSTDRIVLPPFEAFRDAQSYYSTLAHETTHWTAHESRLARDFGGRRFGSEAYAIEELVAELGAAFMRRPLATLSDVALEELDDGVWCMSFVQANVLHRGVDGPPLRCEPLRDQTVLVRVTKPRYRSKEMLPGEIRELVIARAVRLQGFEERPEQLLPEGPLLVAWLRHVREECECQVVEVRTNALVRHDGTQFAEIPSAVRVAKIRKHLPNLTAAEQMLLRAREKRH